MLFNKKLLENFFNKEAFVTDALPIPDKKYSPSRVVNHPPTIQKQEALLRPSGKT